MKENSIKNERSSMEETIKTIEKMIKSYKEADKCGLSNNDFKNEIKALEHILSDYRRLLKENECLKNHIHYKNCMACGKEFKIKSNEYKIFRYKKEITRIIRK